MDRLEDFLGGPHEFRQDGDIIVAAEYIEQTVQSGLDSFDAFFSMDGVDIIKQVRTDRATYIRKLDTGGGKIDIYIKRTIYKPLSTWLKNTIKLKRENPSALHELANLLAFREKGLPVAEPIAAGFRKRDGLCESFVATLPLPADTRLPDYIEKNWKGKLLGEELANKRKIIQDIAGIARRMHEACFNHRDFYLVHFLINRENCQLYLLDLNRADRRTRPVERWFVKDLGALDFSASPDVVLNTDRVRFMRAYLGRDKFIDEDKEFIAKVRRKALRLGAHAAKADERDRKYVEEKGGTLPKK